MFREDSGAVFKIILRPIGPIHLMDIYASIAGSLLFVVYFTVL